MTEQLKTSSGVEKLIEKLRSEGVKAGEEEAQRLVSEAEKKSAELMAKAKAEADELFSKAHAEIEREKQGALESLQLGLRDAIIELRERLTTRFKVQLGKLVEAELLDRDFLKKLILVIAGHAAPPKDEEIEILFSRKGIIAENGGIAAGQSEKMDSFIAEILRETLRQGLAVTPSSRDEAGIRIRLRGTDVEVDLSDGALSELILSHLTPRIRHKIEGAHR
ncbi:MAG: hypothetical protein RDV48_00820 [Candidatus Eremiobacteraeota bacterium]|nr:hypothetical protein [Candidatus Eremiobacteraeota bacterium]